MKNRYRLIPSVFLCLLLMNCSSDDNGGTNQNQDPDTDPVQENRSPGDFELFSVVDFATDISLFPLFEWEATEDPDGDTIVYDIFLDQNTAETLVAEDIAENKYVLTNRLERNTQYFWKVVAKDGNGGTNESDIFSFLTRDLEIPSAALTNQAQFGSRVASLEMAIEFQDRLWIVGGVDENGISNEIWVSDDGQEWISQGNAPFSPRERYTLTVFEDRLWLIGGRDDNGITSEIWFTANGTDWDFITNVAASRFGHSTAVFDNKLWILGGLAQQGSTIEDSNDILMSTNGLNWSSPVSTQKFPPRAFHKTGVLNNQLVLLGGIENNNEREKINDIWASTNGVNWAKVTDFNIDIENRSFYDMVFLDDKIWFFGGRELGTLGAEDAVYYNDVWVTDDGGFWSMFTDNGQYGPRAFHDAVTFEGNIFLIGGIEGVNQTLQDVWKFE